ncbi:S8 family serine peptidase [Hyphomicrobiales bacterium]|nr:S8 family serine peptidase [Hyphomicrobiales bacterium]
MANESEPNNSRPEADPIDFDETVIGNISDPGEQDYYQINVSSPGTINIAFDVPTNSSENDYFAIGVTRGQELLAKYYIGSDTNISIPAQYSGTYYIWFDNRYDANATKGSGLTLHDAGQYSFVASFSDTLGNVELEDNSRLDNATPIIKNTEYTGQINRVGDGDFYKISIDNPGDLELIFTPSSTTNTEDFSVEIITSDGSQALQVVKTGSTAILTQAISSAGDYLVRVNSGNQTINDDPYTIKVTTTEPFSNVEIESNDSKNEATVLTNVTLTGQLSNSEDRDYYEFTTNGPGRINVTFDPTISSGYDYFTISILEPSNATLSSFQTGKDGVFSAYVNSSGKYYILVQSTNRYDSDSYTISAAFLSGSHNYETEGGTNNDSWGNYSDNIVLGEMYTGQLYNSGDSDTFSFTIDQPGSIDLTFDPTISSNYDYFTITIRDSDGSILSQSQAGNNSTLSATAKSSGTYYVQIQATSRWSDDPYQLKVTAAVGKDIQYSLSSDVTNVSEGNSVTFTVNADTAPTSNQTFTYQVEGSASGSTSAASSSDFSPSSGTFTISSGSTSSQFTVNASTDNITERNEGFKVTVSNSSSQTVGSKQITINGASGGFETITRKDGDNAGVSIYFFENNEIVEMGSNRTVIKNSNGNELFIISDVNTSNAILHSGVTRPTLDDPNPYYGGRFKYINETWSLNENFVDTRDDDISYSLSSDATNINEGNSVTLTLTANGGTPTSNKTFTYQVEGSASGSTSAASSSDFSPSSGSFTISKGSTTSQFTVNASTDNITESNEGFKVTAFDSDSSSIGSTQITINGTSGGFQTITWKGGDNAGISIFFFENNEIVEMESNRTVIKNSSGNEILIISDVNTSNATLHSGVTKPDDWFGYKYIYTNGSWSLNEDWEDPRDDNISYSLSSDATTINEGNSVTFQVTGNSTASSDKTFTYQVEGNASGSTSAASSSDFSPTSGTLTISSGSTSTQFSVNASSDNITERNEGFKVTAFDSDSSSIGSKQITINGTSGGFQTITRKDGDNAGVSIYFFENNEIVEMGSNRTVIKNSNGNELFIISDVNTSNAILHSGVTRPTLDDPNPYYGGRFKYINETWSLNENFVDTRDDDISYSLSSDATNINEGNSVTLTLTANGGTPTSNKTFTYQVEGSASGSTSAASSSDFSPSSGSFTISKGSTTSQFTVNASTDNITESNEGFKVTAFDSDSSSIGSTQITINNDPDYDISYSLSSDVTTIKEGGTVTFKVTADSALSSDKTFTYELEGDTNNNTLDAASSSDFSSSSSKTFVINAGTTSSTFSVTLNKDTISESQEGLKVTVFNSASESIGSQSIIINNVDEGQIVKLSSGSKVTGSLSKNDEEDLYSITLNQGGTISVDFDSPLNSSDSYFHLYIQDSNSNIIAATEIGKDYKLEATVDNSGEYFIGIESHDANGGYRYNAGNYGITATVGSKLSNAETELNDTRGQADALADGSKIFGQLHDDKDEDYYVINMSERGTLKLEFDSPLNSSTSYFNFGVRDNSGNIISQYNKGSDFTADITVEAGQYYIFVRSDKAAGGYEYNSDKYGLRVTKSIGQITGEVESNNNLSNANPLEAGKELTGQLNTNTDIDWFVITVADNTEITYDFNSPLNSSIAYFQVGITDSSARTLNFQNTGNDTSITYLAKDAGTYYVYVWSDKASGGYNFNDDIYGVKVTTKKKEASSSDTWEPNDTFDTAASIASGDEITGSLTSSNDTDIYSLFAKEDGSLNVTFTPPNNSPSNSFKIEVFDKDLSLIDSNITGNAISLSSNLEISGTFFVRVTSANSYKSGNYTLTIEAKDPKSNTTDEEDDNDFFYTADELALDAQTKGKLSTRSDEDFYKFSSPFDGSLSIKFDSPEDTYSPYFYIYVYEEIKNGGSFQRSILNNIETGRDTNITFDAVGGRDYYIKIYAGGSKYTDKEYKFTANYFSAVGDLEATLKGTAYSDNIDGTTGDDVIDPNSGDDIIKAGEGKDTVILDISSSSVDVRSLFNISGYKALFGSKDAGKYSNQYKRLFEVEDIKFIDKLLTIESDSSVKAPEILLGEKNLNTIQGTNSSDLIDPIGGKHLIDGKSGTDKLLIFDNSSNFNVVTLEGITDVRPRDSSTVYESTLFRLKSVEKIVFSDKEVSLNPLNKTYIFGTLGSETIRGTSNNDIIDPRGGSDNIKGGFGEDKALIFLPSSQFSTITTSGTISTFTGKSSAEEYANKTITLENVEEVVFTDKVVTINIPGEVLLSKTRFELTEGGSNSTLQIGLSSKPSQNVTITLASSSSDLSISQTTLTFTPNNWSTAKSITLSAVDDSLEENIEFTTINLSVFSNDNKYSSLADKSITVQINDNDKVGYNISGTIWRDNDQDGFKDGNEAILTDWLVYLDTNKNSEYDNGEQKTFTDSNGDYTFYNLDSGEYIVAANLPIGWVLTTPEGLNSSVTQVSFETNDETLSPSGEFQNDTRITMASVNAFSDLIGLKEFKNDNLFEGIDGTGFTVVIIDDGIDLNHPYFGPDRNNDGIADRIIHNWDYVNQSPINPREDSDHGTHVAGIVGSENSVYPGIAPGADLIIFDVFEKYGKYKDKTFPDTYNQALEWVLDHHEEYNIVSVNMSLGGSNYGYRSTSRENDIYKSLENAGVAVVVASGNSFAEFSTPGIGTPAHMKNVISVSAVYSKTYTVSDNGLSYRVNEGELTYFGQRAPGLIDVVAPGYFISSAQDQYNREQYGYKIDYAGTSMAAPIIAGSVALFQQVAKEYLGRKLTVGEIRQLIKGTSTKEFDGDDEYYAGVSKATNANYNLINIQNFSEGIMDLAPAGSYKIALGNSDSTGSNFGFYPASTDVATEKSDYIVGSNRSDNISGKGGNDTILGLSGNDQLFGNNGDDSLSGGSGNDKLDPGLGKDQVDGGSGEDTLVISARKASVEVVASDYGYRAIISSSNYVDFKNIEKIQYSNGTFSSQSLTSTLSLKLTDISYTLSSSNTSVAEGDIAYFTLRASSEPSSDIKFSYKIEGDDNGGSIDKASSNDFFSSTGSFTLKAGSLTKSFAIEPTKDTFSEDLEGFKITVFDSNNIIVGTKTSSIENTALVSSSTDYEITFLDNLDASRPFLESYSSFTNPAGTLNMTDANEIIVATGSIKTIRGLNGDDHYFISELIGNNTSTSIVDTSGLNIIQIPDNTFIEKTQWAKDTVRLTLSDSKIITINNADKFLYSIGGNIFTGDEANSLSFPEFAKLFGIENIQSLNGSSLGNQTNKYITSSSDFASTSDSYKIGSGYSSEKTILSTFSDGTSSRGTQNYTSQDDIIITTNNGTTYRGLSGDDLYFISGLSQQNSRYTIADTKGNNTIQIPDNTKISSSQWAEDSFKMTFENGSVATINAADKFSYELGSNIFENDIGSTLTYLELLDVFDISFTSGTNVIDSNFEYYII